MNKIKITAETIEEFELLKKECEGLHPNVAKGVEGVSRKFDRNVFVLKQQFGSTDLNISSEISSIEYTKEEIRMVCKNMDIFTYSHEVNDKFKINVW